MLNIFFIERQFERWIKSVFGDPSMAVALVAVFKQHEKNNIVEAVSFTPQQLMSILHVSPASEIGSEVMTKLTQALQKLKQEQNIFVDWCRQTAVPLLEGECTRHGIITFETFQYHVSDLTDFLLLFNTIDFFSAVQVWFS